MKSRQKKFLSVLILSGAATLVAGAVSVTANSPQGVLPDNWFRLPEDVAPSLQAALQSQVATPASNDVAPLVDRIFRANAESIQQVGPGPQAAVSSEAHPADWAPWHLDSFTTDLGISASGGIGVLTVKGTPAVQLFWRHQGAAKPAVAQTLAAVQSDEPSIEIAPDSTPADIQQQIDPAIEAVLATGKVQNENRFRTELQGAADQFQQLVMAISSVDTGSGYWVSGFRVDFAVSFSGKVGIGNLGGDTRLRFEWKRAMRTQPVLAESTRQSALDSEPKSEKMDRLQTSLKRFVLGVASDLEKVADNHPLGINFAPYAFRVGVGMSATGDCGFAKGTGSLIGHINFSRNQKAPVIRPLRSMLASEAASNYLVIENSPKPAHLAFARNSNIAYQVMDVRNGGPTEQQASYEISRDQFRKGVLKAMKIASFFAKQGSKVNAESTSGWKIYDVRADFDMSVTGSVGLVSLGGLTSMEMNFYNMSF